MGSPRGQYRWGACAGGSKGCSVPTSMSPGPSSSPAALGVPAGVRDIPRTWNRRHLGVNVLSLITFAKHGGSYTARHPVSWFMNQEGQIFVKMYLQMTMFSIAFFLHRVDRMSLNMNCDLREILIAKVYLYYLLGKLSCKTRGTTLLLSQIQSCLLDYIK